ncbi:aminotransferase [Radicibacter daui]|uniref:aminotransferase n=1 Tax=Radicibacter daui TaxID=3064829 RepID=UPI004046C39B
MTQIAVNPLLVATDVPPIPAAGAWAKAYDGALGPLINLAQAVPGAPPPADFLEKLAAAAGTGAAAAYGPIQGDAVLREALAADINSFYGAAVSAQNITITAGCNQAFFVTMMALAAAGDDVILPAPWYFNHKMTLDMLGIRATPLPAQAQNGFVPSAGEARALIGPRTRAIVLVSPNNPTGATYPAEVLAAFAALAKEKNIALVLDETYRDFLPEGWGQPHQLLAVPDWESHLVQLYSFSKAYAIPGHRLGSVTAAPALIDEIAKVLDCVQICPPRAAQGVVAWAIPALAGWREETRASINARARLFAEQIAAAPGWSISAMGAYFAFVRHPLQMSGEAVAEQLASKAGLIALPGSFFGPGQESHLRFAFANVEAAQLAPVAKRLRAISG